ncbi:MAG: hypothetical protein AAGD33_08675 [Actinomycetota bacterium]
MTPIRLIGALAAVGLLAGACGGGDDDSSPEVVIEGIDPDATPVEAEPVVLDDSADVSVDSDVESSTDEAAESATPVDAAAADASEEELAFEFADCMRNEGVDWPDPVVDADGSIDLLGGTPPADLPVEDAQAAAEVCGSIIAGASFLPNGGQGLDTETRDNLLEFTQCLRDNGVDVDDPDFDALGGGGQGSPLGDFDPNDPANADAIEACQSLFAGAPGGG